MALARLWAALYIRSGVKIDTGMLGLFFSCGLSILNMRSKRYMTESGSEGEVGAPGVIGTILHAHHALHP